MNLSNLAGKLAELLFCLGGVVYAVFVRTTGSLMELRIFNE